MRRRQTSREPELVLAPAQWARLMGSFHAWFIDDEVPCPPHCPCQVDIGTDDDEETE